MTDETEKSGNLLSTTTFKSAGDWINVLLDENCTMMTGATEAVPEQKDKDGNVTQKAVPAKAGKKTLDVEKLHAFATENKLNVKGSAAENCGYPNSGMARMNVGNMARSAAKKRHGLFVGGKWVKAPEGFPVNEEKTENPDGTKIAKAKAPAPAKKDEKAA